MEKSHMQKAAEEKVWRQVAYGTLKEVEEVIQFAADDMHLPDFELRDATDGETYGAITNTWPVVEALCTYDQELILNAVTNAYYHGKTKASLPRRG